MLSDGSINATCKYKDPELFWAVCGAGAGCSFGVVSEFIFQTPHQHQTNDIWSGQLLWPASTALDAVMNIANDLLTTSDPP